MCLKTTFNYFAHILLIFFIITIENKPVCAENTPKLNNGKKWHIGYYEGGPYSDYTDTMRTFVKGLIEWGWIDEQNPPELFKEIPKSYWAWLSQCKSSYLSFKTEDGYSANWDDSKRVKIRKELMDKLRSGSIDLMIAMGTWAGQDLANNKHSVPTMVLSTSNPVKSGIIKSADNSGFDHVTARVDPDRYLRQLRMFHRIVNFKTLGIAFENTPDGRIYSAVNEVFQIAEERGFKVVTCQVIDTTADTEKSDLSCLTCFRQLAKKVDAIYVTALACVDRQTSEVTKIFREEKIPSFSMLGSKLVKEGIMLSISSDTGYRELGIYNATKFSKILNGVKPIELNQKFDDPLDISVNMKTVRELGFIMPESILRISTEIYE